MATEAVRATAAIVTDTGADTDEAVDAPPAEATMVFSNKARHSAVSAFEDDAN